MDPFHLISNHLNGRYISALTTKATSKPISPVLFAIGPVNHACAIEGIGTMHLALDTSHELVLKDVRYVPGIKKCLLSVGQLVLHGYTTQFAGGIWKLKRRFMLVVKGTKRGTLYCL